MSITYVHEHIPVSHNHGHDIVDGQCRKLQTDSLLRQWNINLQMTYFVMQGSDQQGHMKSLEMQSTCPLLQGCSKNSRWNRREDQYFLPMDINSYWWHSDVYDNGLEISHPLCGICTFTDNCCCYSEQGNIFYNFSQEQLLCVCMCVCLFISTLIFSHGS